MSITSCRSEIASVLGRWNELRPMIEPNAPPSARPRISSSISAFPYAAPPEKITMRRPLNALCTTWRARSASVPTGIFSFS